jgi:hypothetical protein
MSPYLLILFLILLALGAPVGIAKNSWLRLLGAMVMSFFVVVLPLFVFFFSSFMVIDLQWKGACRHGWVDCFIVGKLAFTPFVLVAAAALYRLEVLGAKNLTDRWPVLGIYLGAIVAVTCAVFGVICLRWSGWLLVPLYVAVWYVIRAVQLGCRIPVGFWKYFWATLSTIPSWLIAWEWSKQVYQSLPNEAPQGCFIVTAASCGHQNIVGPFSEIEHRGQIRRVNHQLATFWQFEQLWREKSPRTHRLFRCGYNRFGPRIAAHINSPWVADAVFLALKPVELAARSFNDRAANHDRPER